MTGVLLLGQGDGAGLGQGGGQAEHLLVRGRGLRRGRRVDHDLELVPGDPTHNQLQVRIRHRGLLNHSLAVPILVRKVEHLLSLEGVHWSGQQLASRGVKFDIDTAIMAFAL